MLSSGGLEHVLDRVAEDVDGPAEDGPAVHVHVVLALGEIGGVGGRRLPQALALQKRPAVPVRAHAVARMPWSGRPGSTKTAPAPSPKSG